MKKIFSFVAIVAMCVSAGAQIKTTVGETITTTTKETVQERVVTVPEEPKFLSRIQFGYQGISYSWQNGSDWADGFNIGYIAGIRVTKKPLYVNFGLDFEYDVVSAVKSSSSRRHGALEVPFGISYRVRLGSSKIYFTPYAGFHLKFNVLWKDGDDSFLSYDSAKTVQFGGDLGFNFDFNVFYLGVGYKGDFTPAYNYADGIAKCTTGGGITAHIGFVF